MSTEVYCLCREPDDGSKMVACDDCNEWYHTRCINMSDLEFAMLGDNYTCTSCSSSKRPLTPVQPSPGQQEPEWQLPAEDMVNSSDDELDRTLDTLDDLVSDSGHPPSTSCFSSSLSSAPECDLELNDKHQDASEYEVEQVLDMEIRDVSEEDGTRTPEEHYYIKWKRNGAIVYANEWQPLRNCWSCLNLINEWRATQEGLEPYLVPLGASSSCSKLTGYNTNNWINMEEVEELLRAYERRGRAKHVAIVCLSRNLNESIHEQLKSSDKDCIFIIQVNSHAVVGLHLPKARLMFIADGGNRYMQSYQVRCELDKILGTSHVGDGGPGKWLTLKPLQFNQQKGVDHCGSSAVLLANEFQRIYRYLDPGSGAGLKEALGGVGFITVERWKQSKLVDHAHPEPSVNLGTWAPINERRSKERRCIFCSKLFRGPSKLALAAHQRKCPMRQC